MPTIWILGPVEVGQEPRTPPRRLKARILLALLTIRTGTVVNAEEIMDALWAGRPPASARANLHSYVCGLRKALTAVPGEPGVHLESVRGGYRLRMLAEDCDASLFEQLAQQGRHALAEDRPEVADDRLTRALALWRGQALHGVEHLEWTAPTVARLEEGYLSALEDRVQARLTMHRHAGLVVELTDAVTRYPLRERLWGQLMTTLHRTGRRAEALCTYARLRHVLDLELGVEPGPAVRHLYRQIQTGG